MSVGEQAGTHGEPGAPTSDAQAWASVRAALENPKWKFGRTVKGLAKEAGLDRKQVEDLLVRYRSDLVRRDGRGGQSHYALKERVEEGRQGLARRSAVTEDPGRGLINDEDARTRVRKVLKKARKDPRYPLGRRSIDAILKATKLRRDLDPEKRREYVEALLAGQSDIERFEREDGEVLYSLKERDQEAPVDEHRTEAQESCRARELGVDPYPAHVDRPDSVSTIVKAHGAALAKSWKRSVRKRLRPGRIVAIPQLREGELPGACRMGSPGCRPTSGRTPSSPCDFDLFKLLDVGDLVGVEGRIFRTRTERAHRPGRTPGVPRQVLRAVAGEVERARRRGDPLPAALSRPDRQPGVPAGVRDPQPCHPAPSAGSSTSSSYLEVETPMMQRMAGGALARPFRHAPQRARPAALPAGGAGAVPEAAGRRRDGAGLRDQPQLPQRGDLDPPQPRVHDARVLRGPTATTEKLMKR